MGAHPDVIPKGGQARAVPKSQYASDPTLRAVVSLDKIENPREPRFFGNTTMPPKSQTAVRCGGFQRMDWPTRDTGTKQKRTGRSDHQSKERSRNEQSGGGGT